MIDLKNPRDRRFLANSIALSVCADDIETEGFAEWHRRVHEIVLSALEDAATLTLEDVSYGDLIGAVRISHENPSDVSTNVSPSAEVNPLQENEIARNE